MSIGEYISTRDDKTLESTTKLLYGIVRHVDVGWAGAKFKVELTDFNPITPRFDLWGGKDASDRSPTFSVDDERFLPGAALHTDANWNVESNLVNEVTAQGSLAHVRVVRFAINGYPIVPTWGKGLVDVVYDKTISADWARRFCELDFLGDGMFDIDWTDSFTAKVATLSGTTRGVDGAAGNIAGTIGSGTSITNMAYLVVIGDGDAMWERGTATNAVNAHQIMITRCFDRARARPVAVAMSGMDGIQYSARPTFTWRMDGEEEHVGRYGSSYTAFKLQVRQNDSSNTVIYDSGIQRAPVTDAQGNFTWTAPICVGSMITNGLIYATSSNYNWQVIMYNAKFRSDGREFWSAQNGASVFSTAANAQQEVNDHGYSSIAVSVKYAGPTNVLAKCSNMATMKGKVIVQAFTTPDFSGDPLAQGMATSDVDALALGEANAWLKGLPAIGTYYVRAFIDMDGDGKLSEWEPWGYVADEITLVNDGTLAKAPLVSVWIEDSDSDGDWVPDAYEYAASGWNKSWNRLKGNSADRTTLDVATTVLPNGGIVMPIATNKLTAAGISKGLPGASFTAMQSAEFAAALLGLDKANKTTLEAIAEVTRGKLVPNTVKVVSIALEPDGSAVNLSVGADVASGIAGSVVSQYYLFEGSDTVTVNVKVWKKDSLSDSTWTEAYTKKVTLKKDTYGTVVVPIDKTKVDLKSGFFKVDLVEVP